MKLKLSYLLAAALVSTALVAQAQEKKAERPSREEMREKFKNMTPEEREKQIKEWREKQGAEAGQPRPDMANAAKQLGINPEEMRNLTPEERRTKMNEAVDKKLAELNKKKADKTITEEETKFLERLEARKKAVERFKGGPRRNDDGKPQKDAPPRGPENNRSEDKGTKKPDSKK